MAWNEEDLEKIRKFIDDHIKSDELEVASAKIRKLEPDKYWELLDIAIQDESFDKDCLQAIVFAERKGLPINAQNGLGSTRLSSLVQGVLLFDKLGESERAEMIYEVMGDFLRLNYDKEKDKDKQHQDLQDNDGKNALMYAAELCNDANYTMVESLLNYFEYDYQDSVNAYNAIKNNAHLNDENKSKILHTLVNYKFSIEFEEEGFKRFFTTLTVVVIRNDFDLVQDIIGYKADVNAKDSDGSTSLMYAARKANLSIVKLLLDNGAIETINDKNTDGETAFGLASDGNNVEVMKLLLEYGAVPDFSIKNNSGKTVLHLAATGNDLEFMRLLLKNRNGLDVNAKDNDNKSAFRIAVEKQSVDMMNLLLEHGATAGINTGDISGETALHIAAKLENIDMIESLIKNGADVNARYDGGKTALTIAMEKRNFKMMELLLNAGAKVNYDLNQSFDSFFENNIQKYTSKKDYNFFLPGEMPSVGGWSAVRVAVERQDADMVEFLLKKGCDSNSSSAMVEYILIDNYKAQIRLEVFCQDTLKIAITKGNINIVRLLLDHGAKIDSKLYDNSFTISNLFHRISKKRISYNITVKEKAPILLGDFLRSGIKYPKIYLGHLGLAVETGNVEMVEFLLQKCSFSGEVVLDSLLYTAQNKDTIMKRVILENYKSNFNQKELDDKLNFSLNDYIYKNNCLHIAALLEAGAKENVRQNSDSKSENKKGRVIYEILKNSPKGVSEPDEYTKQALSTLIQHGFKRGGLVKSLLKTDDYKGYADFINSEKEKYRGRNSQKVVDDSIETTEPKNKQKKQQTLSMFGLAKNTAKLIAGSKKNLRIKDKDVEQPLLDKPRSQSTASTDSQEGIGDEGKRKERDRRPKG